MNTLNQSRARRCERTLRRHDTDADTPSCLIDLLTDARHWCDRFGHDFAALDRIAYGHYLEEFVANVRRRT